MDTTITAEGFDTLLAFFKVLGNEQRLKLLGLLADSEYNVGDLALLLDLKEPTVSHHLARLRGLGLVRVRAEGNNRYYALDVGGLERMNKEIFTQDHMASLVTPATAPDQALRGFLKGERITRFPSKQKKWRLLLAWLVEKFDHDRIYDEKEINETITHHNADYATLRRGLVDEGLMARDNHGSYWRLPQ